MYKRHQNHIGLEDRLDLYFHIFYDLPIYEKPPWNALFWSGGLPVSVTFLHWLELLCGQKMGSSGRLECEQASK